MNKKNILLESDRILYVKISENLINDYLKMVNNPNISKYLFKEIKTFTYEDELNWVNEKLEENAEIFSMLEKNTNKFIGNIELMNLENNSAEIGICITEEFQDNHYGFEALKTIINHAFTTLNLNELTLVVFSFNERAIHCYKKLGFTIFKIDKNVAIIDNKEVDDIHMKLLKK